MNNSVLRISSISQEKTSSDGRNYKTVGFSPVQVGGILSNVKEQRRNIWEEGPFGSAGDAIYPHLKVDAKVYGSIETMKTEPYFIESENGKYSHPKTGHPANKATTFTRAVLEGESIEQLARQNDILPAGTTQGEALLDPEEEKEPVVDGTI